MTPQLLIFAKAPVAGLAKTRLIPALGPEGAAALAARMLRHTAAQAVAAGLGPVQLCVTPDSHHPAFQAETLRHGLQLHEQGEGDLGQRMHRAFERVLVAPGQTALLIGTDAPALDARLLRQAAQALSEHEAVFIPALDGGYALIGLHQADARWFTNMTWSTSRVMQATRERLQAAGLRWAELPAVADIDEPADLVHLPEGWWPELADQTPTPRPGA